jgi:LysR family glycine cleavage system transcriptional activator
MMTPELAQTCKSPGDLAKMVLIHDDSLIMFRDQTDWPAWCRAAGLAIDPLHGPRFSQADHALDAAMTGAGVVLGRVTLATRALESGRLVAPFDIGLVTQAQFRFICPLGSEKRPHVAAFEAWVMGEIDASRAFEAGRVFVRAE